MRLVTLNGLLALAALAGATVALPLASGGCGRTACFVYSQGEFDAHGTCPAQGPALMNFTDPHCAGPVASVDGAGVFSANARDPAQSLCCYPVTQQDLEQTAIDGCTPPTGAGGAGGFSTTAAGFGSTGFAVGVGASGSGGCFTCNQELLTLGGNPNLLCQPAPNPWSTLESCICSGSGPCLTPCKLNYCMGASMTKECVSCVQDPTMMSGCSAELSDCQHN